MATVTRFYSALFPWVGFAPIVIVLTAILTTLRVSRHRWIAHVLTVITLLVALPLCIWIQGILDPTTIAYPGPGDGFVLFLYLYCLGPAVLIYSGYAWLSRRKARDLHLHSAEQG
ncbi:MAG TPA: hypothetical protein VLX44_17975 [Xanthobacteraceae bacterium]|nr:hypothetical protein [Xanthobacteraceae bacterium]